MSTYNVPAAPRIITGVQDPGNLRTISFAGLAGGASTLGGGSNDLELDPFQNPVGVQWNDGGVFILAGFVPGGAIATFVSRDGKNWTAASTSVPLCTGITIATGTYLGGGKFLLAVGGFGTDNVSVNQGLYISSTDLGKTWSQGVLTQNSIFAGLNGGGFSIKNKLAYLSAFAFDASFNTVVKLFASSDGLSWTNIATTLNPLNNVQFTGMPSDFVEPTKAPLADPNVFDLSVIFGPTTNKGYPFTDQTGKVRIFNKFVTTPPTIDGSPVTFPGASSNNATIAAKDGGKIVGFIKSQNFFFSSDTGATWTELSQLEKLVAGTSASSMVGTCIPTRPRDTLRKS